MPHGCWVSRVSKHAPVKAGWWGRHGWLDVLQTSVMQPPSTRVDKVTFKQIFRDHWEVFWPRHSHDLGAEVPEVVAKRRVCPTFYTWRFVPGYAVHETD